VGKHYRYLLWHGFGQHVLTSRAWHVKSSQPLEKLCFILKEFEGTHDFAGFRAADCTAKTTVRRVFKIDSWCHPQYSQLMIVDIWGEGFLKNMIRNMVGTAVEMAIGKRKKDTITEAFQHKNRQLVGTCAPGKALTLMEVFYNMEKLQHNIARGARHLILC
jgi:tRNA pseudouridine38-40 synthase